MELIYIVLGSILAIFGGFLHLFYQSRKIQIKEDKNALIQTLDVLDTLKRIPETGKSEKSSFECFDELHHFSLKIDCEEYKNIALEIQEFVKEYRGKDPMGDKGLRSKLEDLRSKTETELKERIRVINIAKTFKRIKRKRTNDKTNKR